MTHWLIVLAVAAVVACIVFVNVRYYRQSTEEEREDDRDEMWIW
jgi:hypothetical protein